MHSLIFQYGEIGISPFSALVRFQCIDHVAVKAESDLAYYSPLKNPHRISSSFGNFLRRLAAKRFIAIRLAYQRTRSEIHNALVLISVYRLLVSEFMGNYWTGKFIRLQMVSSPEKMGILSRVLFNNKAVVGRLAPNQNDEIINRSEYTDRLLMYYCYEKRCGAASHIMSNNLLTTKYLVEYPCLAIGHQVLETKSKGVTSLEDVSSNASYQNSMMFIYFDFPAYQGDKQESFCQENPAEWLTQKMELNSQNSPSGQKLLDGILVKVLGRTF
jgi:hypothetical protein